MCKICFGGVTDPPLHKHTPVFCYLYFCCIAIFLASQTENVWERTYIWNHTNRMPDTACRITHAAYMESKP